ncbi:methyltransferase [Longispora sp. NPDC051575]|uniref:methyltransferase n=1 Tax=Longispora sp. NPDC051575 TaxID=3154943 RepID=UPI00341F1A1E
MTTSADIGTPMVLMGLMQGVWAAKTVAVAHEIGVFEHLSDGQPMALAELARLCDIAHRPAEAVVTTCTALGLLEFAGGECRLTPFSAEYLVEGKPYYFGPAVALFDHHYAGWMRLGGAIRNNRPSTWDDEATDTIFDQEDSTFKQRFWEGMYAMSAYTTREMARAYDFSGVRRILDVGGGVGAHDIELCRHYPDLRATVYDLAPVCEMTQKRIAQEGLAHRVSVHPGDFFKDEALPGGHDAVLFSMILHDWSVQENRTLLGKAFAALPSGGTVMVAELLVDDDRTGPLPAALMDVAMVANTREGRNYTAGEYGDWLREAGFTDVRTVRFEAPAANGLVVGTKP